MLGLIPAMPRPNSNISRKRLLVPLANNAEALAKTD